jgi:hypothetical protein
MALGSEPEREDRRPGLDEGIAERGVARAPDDESETDEPGRHPDAEAQQHHHRFEGCEEMVARGERADPAHRRVHGFAGPARRHGDRARGVRAGDDQGAHQVVEILDNENDTRDAGDTLQ